MAVHREYGGTGLLSSSSFCTSADQPEVSAMIHICLLNRLQHSALHFHVDYYYPVHDLSGLGTRAALMTCSEHVLWTRALIGLLYHVMRLKFKQWRTVFPSRRSYNSSSSWKAEILASIRLRVSFPTVLYRNNECTRFLFETPIYVLLCTLFTEKDWTSLVECPPQKPMLMQLPLWNSLRPMMNLKTRDIKKESFLGRYVWLHSRFMNVIWLWFF